MQEKRKFVPLKPAVLMALLSAMSIVLGKLLAVNLGDVIRISFENLPILFAGIAFGPLAGAVVGAVADIVGCLIVGYAINPFITLGAAVIGATAGFVHKLMLKTAVPEWARLVPSVAAAHINGSVLMKTIGLSVFYGTPFLTLIAWRTLNYLIVGALEGIILFILLRNRGIKRAISSMKPAAREESRQSDKEVNDKDEL